MPVTIEELKEFLSHEPPRPVPPAVRKEAMKRVPLIITLMGLLFAAFGVPFVGIFVPWRLPDDLSLSAGGVTAPDAVVLREESTGMSENDRRVYRYVFEFETAAGERMTGTCYRTGSSFQAGQRVDAQYLSARPAVSRIAGTRLSPFGWGGGFVIIFPIVGLCMVVFPLRSRGRLMRLLRRGRFATGRIVSVDATNVRVNKEMRHRVTVTFSHGFDTQTTTYAAYGADVLLAQQKQAAGESIGLLYDERDPRRVFLVNTLIASG